MLSCKIARLIFEKGPFWLLIVRKLWFCRVGRKIGLAEMLDLGNKKLLEYNPGGETMVSCIQTVPLGMEDTE